MYDATITVGVGADAQVIKGGGSLSVSEDARDLVMAVLADCDGTGLSRYHLRAVEAMCWSEMGREDYANETLTHVNLNMPLHLDDFSAQELFKQLADSLGVDLSNVKLPWVFDDLWFGVSVQRPDAREANGIQAPPGQEMNLK